MQLHQGNAIVVFRRCSNDLCFCMSYLLIRVVGVVLMMLSERAWRRAEIVGVAPIEVSLAVFGLVCCRCRRSSLVLILCPSCPSVMCHVMR